MPDTVLEGWGQALARKTVAPAGKPSPSGLTVAVIGAGPAGICAAKYLRQAGFKVSVFEKGSHIGGLWVYENDSGTSPAYRTLHLNTPKKTSHFRDLPFPDAVGPFPSHWDMHEYLESYADRFGVRELVEFKSPVERIRPASDENGSNVGWTVKIADIERERRFDAVVVASGHLSIPNIVEEHEADFAGRYVHSLNYRGPEQFVGDRVCVVGTGNSAMDIVSDVATIARSTVLVARSGVLVKPKMLLGRPFADLMLPLTKPWVPGRVRDAVIRWLTWLVHGRMEDLGFPLSDGKKTHGTTSATAIQHIAYRRVRVKHHITRIDGNVIHFNDGSSEEFDTLIGATGYRISLPFIEPEIVPVRDNSVSLYQRIVPPGHRNLFFMGMLNSNAALNQLFEEQAQWIIAHLTGQASLPSVDEMHDAIANKDKWVAQNYKDSQRHRIQEEQVYYIHDLRRNLRAARQRAKGRRRN